MTKLLAMQSQAFIMHPLLIHWFANAWSAKTLTFQNGIENTEHFIEFAVKVNGKVIVYYSEWILSSLPHLKLSTTTKIIIQFNLALVNMFVSQQNQSEEVSQFSLVLIQFNEASSLKFVTQSTHSSFNTLHTCIKHLPSSIKQLATCMMECNSLQCYCFVRQFCHVIKLLM